MSNRPQRWNRDQMRALRQQGFSLQRIGQMVGCSRGTVYAATKGMKVGSHVGSHTDSRVRAYPPIPQVQADLAAMGGNIAKLARSYGVNRQTLHMALRRYREAHPGQELLL